MVQALSTGEFSAYSSNKYTSPTVTKSYIYTIEIKYNEEIIKQTKKYPFFCEKTKADTGQSQKEGIKLVMSSVIY